MEFSKGSDLVTNSVLVRLVSVANSLSSEATRFTPVLCGGTESPIASSP